MKLYKLELLDYHFRNDTDTTDVNRIHLIYLVYTKVIYNHLVILTR